MVEGIEELLSEELGIHTVIANPFDFMTVSDSLDQNEIKSKAPQLLVAAGLALRSFTPWHI